MDRILTPDSADGLVRELASLWGVQTEYRDSTGRQRRSPLHAIMQVLGILEAQSDVGPCPGTVSGGTLSRENVRWLREALRERRTRLNARLAPPVMVAWDGRLEDLSSASGAHRRSYDAGVRLPFGYHRLPVEVEGRTQESVVISAPRRCWKPKDAGRDWGLFVPTYALRSERDLGAGDLADLGEVVEQVGSLGGKAVSTLPLLASYLDSPFEPSPYSPVSRLFWNEFYLAVEQTQEWSDCPAARRVWEAEPPRGVSAGPQSQPLVDYAAVADLKRRVLTEMSRHFFREAGNERREALEEYVRRRPDAFAYAAFRARVEAEGADWRSWRGPCVKSGRSPTTLEQLDESGRYHLYCQWQMDEQLTRLSRRSCADEDSGSGAAAAGLFLDVPVGVHPGGYDTWRWRESFAEGVSVGAPPDVFFSQGQTWGSPPPHPERCREDGHSYWRQVLRHHMRHAKLLRLDHVMSLHRLFWIPKGCDASDGVYVRYPADELYAVLCLESNRHQTEVVGEDLGTVAPGVRAEMKRRGLSSTWVLQGSLRPRSPEVIGRAPRRCLAALGTHDMFPLAGFVRGDDIRARVQMGQLAEGAASRALAERRRLISRLCQFLLGRTESTAAELLGACLKHLGTSRAEFVLVGLDDLMLQTEPHNMPGTGPEHGNWRRRLPCTVAESKAVVAQAAQWISRGRRTASTAP